MQPRRKSLLKKAALIYPLIIIGACSPIITAVVTGWIASLFGIQLNEGSPPQIEGVAGQVIAEVLYLFTVVGWLFLLTAPAGVIAIIGYTIFLGVAFIRTRNDPSNTTLPPRLP